jgi:glutathione S-transferase
MITIHHLQISQSERIIWLCEELGLPYTLKLYKRVGLKRLAPPEFLALHPMGLAPVVDIDGIMLAESGAIIEYIVQKFGGGRLQPKPEDANYAEWLFWFHFSNATVMATEMMMMVLRLAPLGWPIRKMLAYRQKRSYAITEARLGEVPWLAGEFTTAEIMMAFPFSTLRDFTKTKLDGYPNILMWLARIGARPAYQRAMAAGDPQMKPYLT